MIIGLHVATAGDFFGIPARARAMGGDTVQYFAGNPRGWQVKDYSEAEGQKFQAANAAAKIQQSFIHMCYLVSYGSPNPELRRKSIESFTATLKNADTLGATGVVTHLGSHKGEGFDSCVQPLADGLVESLGGSERSFAILEISAGAGDNMGNTLEELAEIRERTGKHPRVKFCIDSCHALTAGYELRTKDGLDKFLADADKLLGLENIVVWHINDSKFDLGMHRDRHENIGDGYYGNEGMANLINHPALKDAPGILEVPGLDNNGPDKPNVDRLRALVK